MGSREKANRSSTSAPLVVPLERLGSDDVTCVGSKAANLGAMIRAGLPVPGGFCITTSAFQHWFEACGTAKQSLDGLERLGVEQTNAIREAAGELREKLAAVPVPESVEQAIVTAREGRLGATATRIFRRAEACEPATGWAVRSSATSEDLADASFAGQHDTYLNVTGRDALVEAVRGCWISLFTDRAVCYRMKRHIPHRSVMMAVVVQEMVPAEMAGVLFTVDLATGSAGRMVIEGAQGLGDAVVSGKVSPERIVLKKDTLRIITRRAGLKPSSLVPDAASTLPGASSGLAPNGMCLDDAHVRLLGKLACKVERLFGKPQDIEWAVADHRIYLLQTRPITVIPTVKPWEDRQVWSNINGGEVAPDVMTPMTWSVIQLNAGFSYGRCGGRRNWPSIGRSGRIRPSAISPACAAFFLCSGSGFGEKACWLSRAIFFSRGDGD